MAHEVVVVGGGVGGLTTAALLAARGVDVCLLERQTYAGGCVASFEKFGYTVDPTKGLYSSWGAGEIHDRIFTELPVDGPQVQVADPAYIVRLADGAETAIGRDFDQFQQSLQSAFPDCAAAAVEFYRKSASVNDLLRETLKQVSDFRNPRRTKRRYGFLPRLLTRNRLAEFAKQPLSPQLAGTSAKFQSFITLQLETLVDTLAGECAYLPACVALNIPRVSNFEIQGGALVLADRLVESIKKSGGKVRLASSVLRLSFDANGQANGVDLLSGENVQATRAIVSNMTAWDTYGKLIGLGRTALDLKKELAALRSSGAYLIFAALDEEAAKRVPAERMLVATASEAGAEAIIDTSRFFFAMAPEWHQRAPQGKRAVTISFATDVDEWFSYQKDQNEQEERDQAALELGWQTLHRYMPELGGGIEVIETASPQTYFDQTRRKLGMVGGVGQRVGTFDLRSLSHRTTVPNVFMVGDTTFPGAGVAAVSHSALIVADLIGAQH